jgi:multidrug efflux pump subunit AcrB
MAWAIISGLLASTLLTLLVIPAAYKLLHAVGRGGQARYAG